MKTQSLLAAFGILLHLQSASAAVFSVTNNLDAGVGTLREAVISANNTAGPHVIELNVVGNITLNSALPEILNPVTIVGPGANQLTIRRSNAPGTPDFRIFDFNSSNAGLSGVTLANGAADQGGGLLNRGQLTVSNCVITANFGRGSGRGAGVRNLGQLRMVLSTVSGNLGTGSGFNGGGIDTGEGQLELVDSTVSGNQANRLGGGIFVGSGIPSIAVTPGVMLLRSTISGNTAGTDGGGINVSGGSGFPVGITNCTISGNLAQRDGGGIICVGGLTRLISSTIASNNAVRRAGGLFVDSSATTSLKNTIIARNINTERPDVAVGTPRGLISLGHNLIGQENSSAELIDGQNGDIVGNPGGPVNPLLGPLRANVGPTFTHALLPGSRAIDAGDNTDAPATDQQGLARIVAGTIDIGAFEVFATPPTITCPANIIVSNSPGQCGAAVSFAVQSTGTPAPVVTTSIPSGAVFPVGTTVVACVASNAAGTAACSFTVTVVDAEAPAISCPSPIVVPENSVGAGFANVIFPRPLVADNCGTNLSVTFSPASGSAFPLGTSTVTCVVVDAAGNSNSCTFPVTVQAYTTATIPASPVVCPGSSVTLQTIPGGTGPFTFVWSKGGQVIAAETNATINLANVSAADAATYCVVVSGAVNAVTNCGTLTVSTNTSASGFASQTVCPGTAVQFCTVAAGTGPFAYTWLKDGAVISNANNACLDLTNVTSASAGNYSVVVSGACNSVTNSANLTVLTNTTAAPLVGQAVCPGTPVQFCTVASGTGPFTYSWFKDGMPINGASGACLDLSSTSNGSAGAYSVVVSGQCNAVTNSAVLTVWTNISFAPTPPVVAPPKSAASLCSPASGTGPITYQWFRGGNPIAGATNSCLTLTNVSLADEGDYCVVAAGLCSTASNCVNFMIQRDGLPPRIVAASILCADDSAGLTRVLLTYSEELVAATALNLANYSIPGLNITNISGGSNGNTYLLETDAPFRCGFTYGLQVSSIQDISGEVLTSAVTNLSTASLPCCNNSYVLALPAGLSLVANQLDRGFNTLTDVLPVVPEGSIVQVLKSSSNAIDQLGYPVAPEFDSFTFSGGRWSGNAVVSPGSGFFIYVPRATNVLIRGSLPAAKLPLPFPDSPQLVSRQSPVAGSFQDIFGAPPVEGMAVYRHVSTNGPVPIKPPDYERFLFRNGVWEGGVPYADVGEAWLVQAIQPVVIVSNPVSQVDVTFGSTITFNVLATGSPELRYQWRHNGLNLPGQTNSTLVITNVQLIDGGAYSVTVGNFFNTVESSSAFLSLLVFDLPGIPLTNNYGDRVVLTQPAGLGNSSNVGATKEPGEPNHAGKPGGKSMWIDWRASASGIVTFATTGSSFDTLLAVYTNGPNGLVEVASDEESGGFLTSKLAFYANAGQTYSIAVDGFGGEEGLIVFGWSLEPTTDKLPVLVEPPQSVVAGIGDTVIFTARALGQNLRYQWYFNGGPLSPPQRQSPDTGDQLRIKTAGPQNAGLYVIRVFEGTRYIDSQPISLQFNMEGLNKQVRRVLSTDKLLDALIIPPVALAADVVAAVDGGALATATASASATVQRSYTGTQIFSTFGAVKQPGEPNHCGIPGGASQWYLYEPPDDGTAFINTDGSTFDTVLAVYTGPGDSFSTLVPVTCDNNSGSNGITSRVSFPAKFGTAYYVAVDGVNGVTGTVYLNYSLLKPIGVTNLTMVSNGAFRVQASVTPEVSFVLQRSTNFFSWTPILTNFSTNGNFQYIDTGSRSNSRSSYRLIQRP